jgi:hypothetical protein
VQLPRNVKTPLVDIQPAIVAHKEVVEIYRAIVVDPVAGQIDVVAVDRRSPVLQFSRLSQRMPSLRSSG